MAGGGLMQLVANGRQDKYLTGNPMVTFFKASYRNYTNFAMESVPQTLVGNVGFGNEVQMTAARVGDMVHKMLLEVTLPALSGTGTQAWARYIGHVLLQEVRYELGSQTIDRHYTQWLQIWHELTTPAGHRNTYRNMVGDTTVLTTEAENIPQTKVYIPLQFDFCRNPGLAIPYLALPYHDLKIYIKFRPFNECYVSSSGTVNAAEIVNATLYIDYIYLSNTERKKLVANASETLIEQVQFTGKETFSSVNIRQKLNFNHPCKAVYVLAQLDANVQGGANRWVDFTDSGSGDASTHFKGRSPIVDMLLQTNGTDRFQTRDANYFNMVQPYYHFSNGPATGIHVYSFALRPEEYQPTGTFNFSKVDNVSLNMTLSSSASTTIYTFVMNYNIRKVISGMAGIAFAS